MASIRLNYLRSCTEVIILIVCLILAYVPYAGSFSTGATTESCVSLVIVDDGGATTQPQQFFSWYTITIVNDDGYYTANRTVRVVIEAISGTTFTGFILQARASATNTPVGRWREPPANTQLLTCGAENDTVTHATASVAMTRLELEWTPEEDSGEITFWASIYADPRVFLNVSSTSLTHRVSVLIRTDSTTVREDVGYFKISLCLTPLARSNVLVGLRVMPLSGEDNGLDVPGFVVIPTGTDCIERNATVTDDTDIGNTRTYLIVIGSVAPAHHLLGDPLSISIVDNDASLVTLRVSDSSIQENVGQFSMFICAEPPASTSIEIALTVTALSGDASGLSVPGSVVIPSGMRCVVRNATVADNTNIDETRAYMVAITSLIPSDHSFGSPLSINIVDDDVVMPSLVSVRSDIVSFQEDIGQFAISVCAEPPPESDISVDLEILPSSGPGNRLSVSGTVIIPSGADCVELNVTVADDLIPGEDGVSLIRIISVTPPNNISESVMVTVLENDDACSVSPCSSNSNCFLEAGGDGFICECEYGYMGDTCNEEVMFLPVSLRPSTLTITEGESSDIIVCYTGDENTTDIEISVSFETASFGDISANLSFTEPVVRVTDTDPCAVFVMRAVEDNIVEEEEELSLKVAFVSTNSSLSLDERMITTTVFIVDVVRLPCDSAPCQNGGQCSQVGEDSFDCQCTGEYDGETCDRRIVIPCSSSPCRNGGTCSNIGEIDFDCDCQDGFVGRDCSLDNPCSSSPCRNGGTCSDVGASSFECECREEFVGRDCSLAVECISSPCRNGGTCIKAIDTPIRCECRPSFRGDTCELNDLCYGGPCMNGGTCENTDNNYRCLCPSDFTGSFCDILTLPPRPCVVNPCRNGGMCNPVDGSATCACQPGWTGHRCQESLPPEVNCPDDLTDYCQNGGACRTRTIDPTDMRCICPLPYTGPRCETVLAPTVKPNNPCEPNPCQNNGRCFPLTTIEFACTCEIEWTGTKCERCVTNRCLNGGTCTNVDGQPGCVCPAGVAGSRCERVETCQNVICDNGGFCIVANGDPVCNCREGFMGEKCSTVDPCTGVLCLNGGRCDTTTGACECPNGFGGDICELESSPRRNSLQLLIPSMTVIYMCAATYLMLLRLPWL